MRASTLSRTLSYSVIALLGLALLTFLILKARSCSFTHDESYSYLHYVHQSFMDIISYKTPYTNNHILNTLLMKYAEELSGSSELVLRFPNILACLIYMIYASRIIRHFPNLLLVPAFLCLIANTQLIDFFALARGYGLSFAFMLMSFHHLSEHIRVPGSRQLILFHTGAFLAILSNFSLINFYVAALLAHNLIAFLQARQQRRAFQFFRENRIHLMALPVMAAVLYEPIRKISRQGMLDFGGKEGFVENTLGSLIKGLFYETPLGMPLYTTLKVLMVVTMLGGGLFFIRQLLRKDRLFLVTQPVLVLSWLILAGIATLSYLQHALIHNDFYTGRFALFIYPLFMLLLLSLISYGNKAISARAATLGLLAICLSAGVFLNQQLRFYQEWKYDAGTKTVIGLVRADRQQSSAPQRRVRLGINWLFEPTVNFYRYTYRLDWLREAHRKGAGPNDDYYYLFRSDTNAYLGNGKVLLFELPGVNTFLVKNQMAGVKSP